MAKYTTTAGKGGTPSINNQIKASDIINHTHDITINMDPNTFVTYDSMPDFTRAQQMQTANTDTYAAYPGGIFKINVPGYFFVGMTHAGYGDQIDMFIKLATRPWYLFRNYAQSGKYGPWSRPLYTGKAFKYGGWVNGAWYVMNMIPIYPGVSTYMRWCDASSYNTGKQPGFIPCIGVSDKINPKNFFTRVAVGQNEIASAGTNNGGDLTYGCSVFAGDWKASFDSNNNLIKTAAAGYYTFIGRIYCSNGHHNGAVFYPLDPSITNVTHRVYWCSSGTWIMKYITAAQSATIVSGLGKNATKTFKLTDGTQYTYKKLAESLANRWAIVHNTFNQQSAYNKMSYVTHFQASSTTGNPVAGTWLRGPHCGHTKDLKISYDTVG